MFFYFFLFYVILSIMGHMVNRATHSLIMVMIS